MQAAWRAATACIVPMLLSAGCVTDSSTPSTPKPIGVKPRGTPNPVTVAPDGKILDTIENPSGYTFSLGLLAEHIPLGAVPYDGFLLPLISPDGHHVATQTGAPPEWAATLAEPGATPSRGTTVEVYAIDTRGTIAADQREQPQRVASLQESILLGRSCDDAGFLVEAPQPDGSRWIGKATWLDGEIEWLVQGAAVNAFASLAPDGRLAWCRRSPDGAHFELVVRNADGTEWSVPGGGGDWLMPVWSSLGDGLFAIHRQNERLRLCYGQAAGSGPFTATLHDFLLIAHSDKYAAYQAFISQGGLDGMLGGAQPQTLAFHPGAGRMIIWKPLASKATAATLLNARSLAALQQSSDSVIVCLGKELLLQSLRNPEANIVLSEGTFVPRRTPRWTYPYVLLSPRDGRVNLTGMRLLHRDDSAPAATPR